MWGGPSLLGVGVVGRGVGGDIGVGVCGVGDSIGEIGSLLAAGSEFGGGGGVGSGGVSGFGV